MGKNDLNTKKNIEHWISSSDKDYRTMMNLYKSKDFYKLCTKEFTDTWINNITGLRKWIKEEF